MLQRLGFPDVGDHRRFVAAISVDAVGSGVFMPVAVLYFLATTPLSLVEVGAALSLAAAVSLPAGPLLGSVVDRWGARQVLLAGNALQAAGFVAYLWSESFAAVLGWTVVVSVGRTAFWGSYGNIVAVIARPGAREQWFGFLGALRNVGFAVGGLAAGLAISVGTDAAYAAVVALNAASYAVALGLLLAVPDHRPPRGATPDPTAGGWATVVRDRPYRMLATVQLVYSLAMMVLNVALPVYATEVLGLPGWVTGAVFTLNTLMVGLGQGLVVRRLAGRVRWRVLVATKVVFATSFLVLLAAAAVPPVVAVAVVLVGSAVFTTAELLGGPVLGALATDAAPDGLRGRYLSVVQLAWAVAGTVAPFSFAWLLDRGPSAIWLALTALVLLGAVLARLLGTVMAEADRRVTVPSPEPRQVETAADGGPLPA